MNETMSGKSAEISTPVRLCPERIKKTDVFSQTHLLPSNEFFLIFTLSDIQLFIQL